MPEIDLPPLGRLPASLRVPAAAILAEADEILDHRMRFVSDRQHDYGDPIRWKVDPLTGERWPDTFHRDLEIVDLSKPSDPIRVWELSRGHQLLTLARASRLAPRRSAAYLGELATQLDDWIQSNPVGFGINWGNSMEAAIRATNWVWAIAIAGPGNLPPETVDRVTASLQQHGRFIRRNPDGTRLRRRNHIIAGLMGLLVIGQAVEGDPELEASARYAARNLPEEIERQTYRDGGNFEGSGLYHGLVLEMLGLSALCLTRSENPLPEAARARIAAMVDFAVAIRHPDGRTSQHGDSDSGRILPAGFDRPPSHDAVIWVTAAILGHDRPLTGEPDPEIAWNLGLDAWEEMARRPSSNREIKTAFPETGIFVLEGGETRVIANCGSIERDGIGVHSHSDALSFEASFGGVPVIVDPGTFSYTGDPEARNLLRSTASHPTPRVDGVEISPFRPDWIFRIDEISPPFVIRFEQLDDRVELEAGHDAYLRLPDPVTVRRLFRLRSTTGALEVDDLLEGSGRHSISMPIPLLPEVEVAALSRQAVTVSSPRLTLEVAVSGAVIQIDEGPYSPGYGIRVTAPRLLVQWKGELPHSVTLTVSPLT